MAVHAPFSPPLANSTAPWVFFVATWDAALKRLVQKLEASHNQAANHSLEEYHGFLVCLVATTLTMCLAGISGL